MDPVTLTLLIVGGSTAAALLARHRQGGRAGRLLGPPDEHGLLRIDGGLGGPCWVRAGVGREHVVAQSYNGELRINVDAPRLVATTLRLGARLERDIVRGPFGDVTAPFGTANGNVERALLASDEVLAGAPAAAVDAFAASADVKAAVSAVLAAGGRFVVGTTAVIFVFPLRRAPHEPAVRRALDLTDDAVSALAAVARTLPVLEKTVDEAASTSSQSGTPFAVRGLEP